MSKFYAIFKCTFGIHVDVEVLECFLEIASGGFEFLVREFVVHGTGDGKQCAQTVRNIVITERFVQNIPGIINDIVAGICITRFVWTPGHQAFFIRPRRFRRCPYLFERRNGFGEHGTIITPFLTHGLPHIIRIIIDKKTADVIIDLLIFPNEVFISSSHGIRRATVHLLLILDMAHVFSQIHLFGQRIDPITRRRIFFCIKTRVGILIPSRIQFTRIRPTNDKPITLRT